MDRLGVADQKQRADPLKPVGSPAVDVARTGVLRPFGQAHVEVIALADLE